MLNVDVERSLDAGVRVHFHGCRSVGVAVRVGAGDEEGTLGGDEERRREAQTGDSGLDVARWFCSIFKFSTRITYPGASILRVLIDHSACIN